MSDAPETIWIDALGIPDSEKYAGTYYLNDDEDHHTIKYRLADLPPTHEQLEADPRVKAIMPYIQHTRACGLMSAFIQGKTCTCGLAAALAQLKEPKT